MKDKVIGKFMINFEEQKIVGWMEKGFKFDIQEDSQDQTTVIEVTKERFKWVSG